MTNLPIKSAEGGEVGEETSEKAVVGNDLSEEERELNVDAELTALSRRH